MALPPRSRIVPIALVGGAAAVVSSFIPLSYDEGDWLATTRRFALGGSLYRDLLENKTPPFLALVRGLDALPGPYTVARGLFLGLVVAAVGGGVLSMCKRLGADERTARNLGLVMAGGVALQSMFVLDIEKPALLFVLGGVLAIAHGRPATGGTLVALASLYDIRTVLFIVGAVVFSAERGGRSWAMRCALPAVVLVAGLTGLVFANPDLRYALIELNAATRVVVGWRPGAMLVVALAAMLPVITGTLIILIARSPSTAAVPRVSRAGATMLLTAIAIAIASRFPFYKYWVLAVPGAVLVAVGIWPRVKSGRSPMQTSRATMLLVLSAIPSLIHATGSNIEQARIVSRYERAAGFLGTALPRGGRFAAFDIQPFLGVYLPERAAVHWTVLDFVAVETSRSEADLERAARAIGLSDVIVDDGALSVTEDAVGSHYRPMWRLFRSRLGAFTCIRTKEGLTFRFRPDRCP